MQLLQYTALLPRGRGPSNLCNVLPNCPAGSGQWNSYNALPHFSEAKGRGSAAIHFLAAAGSG